MKRIPFLTATLSLLGVCLLYIPPSWADDRQTISAGRAHTLIIGDSNTLWAWGDNDLGQVGDGSTTDRVIPARIAILAEGETEEAVGWRYLSAGGQHSAAIRLDGTLWVWGDKQFGQLGQGLDISGNQPTPLQVGSDTDWDAVSAGESHTLALKANGSLWTWGSNALGEAGIGSVASNVLLPVQVSQAGEVWVAIAAGQNSSAAIRSDGTLWTWGSNANGQLGIGSIIEVVDGTFINNTFKALPTQVGSDTDWAQIAVGDQHMLALKTGRTLWAWGLNNFNQVSPSNDIQILSPTQVGTDSDWTLISAGQLHSMALKSNGSLFGQGSNLSGQIGLGTVANASVMTLVSAETNWIDLSAGSLFSVLRRNDGLVRSTGDNSQGQLGNGSTDSRTDFGDASFGLPDLTISAVAIATADPAPGTSITVNVFLLNEGSAAVPANSNLMVNLRLSLDTVYNSLDDSLAPLSQLGVIFDLSR